MDTTVFPHRDHEEATMPEGTKCPICRHVMEDPISLTPCGHNYDHDCITKAQKRMGRICPRDHTRYTAIVPQTDLRRLILSTYKVKCVNARCEVVMPIGQLERHLNDECEYRRGQATSATSPSSPLRPAAAADLGPFMGALGVWELQIGPTFPHREEEEALMPEATKCAICSHVMQDPTLLTPCGHTYDQPCVVELQKTMGRICPRDHTRYTALTPQPDFRHLIDEAYRVKCINEACETIIPVGWMEKHVRDDCEHTKYRCLARDSRGATCDFITTRAHRASHFTNDCPHRPIRCQYCNSFVMAKDLSHHLDQHPVRSIIKVIDDKLTKVQPEGPIESVVDAKLALEDVARQRLRRSPLPVSESTAILFYLLHRLVSPSSTEPSIERKAPMILPVLDRLIGDIQTDPDTGLPYSSLAIATPMTPQQCQVIMKVLHVLMDCRLLAGVSRVLTLIGCSDGERDAFLAAGIPEGVMEAMEACPLDVTVQQWGCFAIHKLAAGIVEQHYSEAARMVVLGMESYLGQKPVQLYGCAGIAALAYGADRMNQLKGQQEACADAVVKAIKLFGGDIYVQIWALRALVGLATGHIVIQHRLDEAGACHLVVEAFERYPSSKAVNVHGLELVAVLSGCFDRHKGLLIEAVVCDVMRGSFAGDADIQYMGCTAIMELARRHSTMGIKRMREAGVVSAVLNTMQSCPASQPVQTMGCQTIRVLVDDFSVDLDGAGAVEAVVKALDLWPLHVSVQLSGLEALEALTSAKGMVSRLMESGAYDVIIKALAAFPNEKEIQVQGSKLVARRSMLPADQTSPIMDAKACEAVVTALRIFPDDEAMQELGCSTISVLASSSPRALAEAGAFGVVTRAVRKFYSNEVVQHSGIQTMRVLLDESCGNPIPGPEEEQGCEVVLKALEQFPDNRQVNVNCLQVLRAAASSPTVEMPAPLEACNTIIKSMESFPADSEVQELGASTISAITETVSPAGAVRDMGALDIVMRAMDLFPRRQPVQRFGLRVISALLEEKSLAGGGQGVELNEAIVGKLTIEALYNFPLDYQVQLCGLRIIKASKDFVINCGAAPAEVFRLVVKAMETYGDCRDMQTYGIELILSWSASKHHPTYKHLLIGVGACEVVVSMLKSLPTDVLLQQGGLEAIGTFAESGMVGKKRLGDCGVVGVVLRSLETFPSRRPIQHLGLQALGLLLDDDGNLMSLAHGGGHFTILKTLQRFDSDIDIQVSGLRVLVDVSNTLIPTELPDPTESCPIIITAMQRYPTNRLIQRYGCDIIALWSSLSSDHKIHFIDVGAAEVVMDALHSYGEDEEIQRWGCATVFALAHDNGLGQERLGGLLGAYGVVMKAVVSFPESHNVQHVGCRALGALLNEKDGGPTVISPDETEGQLILRAFGRFSHDLHVQLCGLRVLKALGPAAPVELAPLVVHATQAWPQEAVEVLATWSQEASNRSLLDDAGAGEAVVKALQSCPTDLAMHRWGLMVTIELAQANSNAKRRLGELGACQVVVSTVKAFREDLMIQLLCFQAIDALITGDYHNWAMVVTGDLCAEVITSLWRHSFEKPLVLWGVRIIRALTWRAGLMTMVADPLHACRTVVEAMKVLPEDWCVLDACKIIHAWSTHHPGHKTLLIEAGACEAVVDTLKAFINDQEICQCSLTAMAALADSSPTGQHRLGQAGGCELVVRTLLKSSPPTLALIYPACDAVKALAADHSNRKRLVRAGAKGVIGGLVKEWPGDHIIRGAARALHLMV